MSDNSPQQRRSSASRIDEAKRRSFKPKQFIFRENETGDQAFVIMDGKVEILKLTEQGQETLAILGKGAMFGEMALIDDELRMASARPLEGPATLLVVTREMFEKKLSGLDPFTRGLIKILSDNIRSLSKSS